MRVIAGTYRSRILKRQPFQALQDAAAIGSRDDAHWKDSLSHFRQMVPALPLAGQHAQNALQFFPLRSIFDERESLLARQFEQFLVANRIRDVKAKFAGLPRTEEFARAAKQEIRFRDVESVRRAHHGVEPRAGFVGHAKRRYQDAMRFLRATADAPAKLVQLCEPEALSMLNDHYRGVGHIHADFHYGCGDKD